MKPLLPLERNLLVKKIIYSCHYGRGTIERIVTWVQAGLQQESQGMEYFFLPIDPGGLRRYFSLHHDGPVTRISLYILCPSYIYSVFGFLLLHCWSFDSPSALLRWIVGFFFFFWLASYPLIREYVGFLTSTSIYLNFKVEMRWWLRFSRQFVVLSSCHQRR